MAYILFLLLKLLPIILSEPFLEAALPDLILDTSNDDVPANSYINLEPVPVTVFTSLTALIEQYRAAQQQINDDAADVNQSDSKDRVCSLLHFCHKTIIFLTFALFLSYL